MTRTFPFRARGRGVRRLPGEMNKTEAAYAEQLELRRLAGELLAWWFEPMTLRMAKRTGYTPDFVVMLPDERIEFHEVKGFMEDDAAVKLKVCRQQFEWLGPIVLVRKVAKRDGGGWKLEGER